MALSRQRNAEEDEMGSSSLATTEESKLECIFATSELRRLASFAQCCFQVWLHMTRELLVYRDMEDQRRKLDSRFDRMFVVWKCLDTHSLMVNCFSTWGLASTQSKTLKDTSQQLQRLHDGRYTSVLKFFNHQYELALIVWAWVDNASLAFSCWSMWLDTVEVQRHSRALATQYNCYLQSIASGEFNTLQLLVKFCFRSWSHRSREHTLRRHARGLEADCQIALSARSAQRDKAMRIIESSDVNTTNLRVQCCLRSWAHTSSEQASRRQQERVDEIKLERTREADRALERSTRNLQYECILSLLAAGDDTANRRLGQCCLRSWSHFVRERSFQHHCIVRGMRHDRIFESMEIGESCIVRELRLLCCFQSWAHISQTQVARAERWKLWLDSREASRHARRCDEKCDKALSVWASADVASLMLGCFWTWSETVLDMKQARTIAANSFIARFTRNMQYDRVLQVIDDGEFAALRSLVQCCLRSWAFRSLEKTLKRHARAIEADKVILRSGVRRQYDRILHIIASGEMHLVHLRLLCLLRSWLRLSTDSVVREQLENYQLDAPRKAEGHAHELKVRDDMYCRAVAIWSYCDKVALCQACFLIWVEAVEETRLKFAVQARAVRSDESYSTALDIWECFTLGSLGLYCFATWTHFVEQVKLRTAVERSQVRALGEQHDMCGQYDILFALVGKLTNGSLLSRSFSDWVCCVKLGKEVVSATEGNTRALESRRLLFCGQILVVITLFWSRACMVQARCCLLAWSHLAMEHLAWQCRRTLASTSKHQPSQRESSAPPRTMGAGTPPIYSASNLNEGTPTNGWVPIAVTNLSMGTPTNGWVPVAISPRGLGPGIVASSGDVAGSIGDAQSARYPGTPRSGSKEGKLLSMAGAPSPMRAESGMSLAASMLPPRLVPLLS